MIKVTAILCLKCKCLVYSRAHHDCRMCPCGKVGIDGGFLYTRILGDKGNYVLFELPLPYTAIYLHKDWNERIDKLGIIKPLLK